MCKEIRRVVVYLVTSVLLGASVICLADDGVVQQLDEVILQLKALEDRNSRLEEKLAKLVADSDDDKKLIQGLTQSMNSITGQIANYTTNYWPLFINCGENWEALYVAHALNVQGKVNYYFQVYASEDRSVQFKPDGTYLSGTGHVHSRSGCTNKSIDDLRDEGRTVEVIRSKP